MKWRWGTEPLYSFLQSIPTLTQLSIDLGRIGVGFDGYPEVTLPSLSLLHLGVAYHKEEDLKGPLLLKDFLRRVRMPRLDRLSIELRFVSLDQIGGFFDDLFNEPTDISRVTQLDLKMIMESPSTPLKSIFQYMNLLERLRINVYDDKDFFNQRTNIFGTDFLLDAFDTPGAGRSARGPRSRQIHLHSPSKFGPLFFDSIFNDVRRMYNWHHYDHHRIVEFDHPLHDSREMIRLHRSDGSDRMVWAYNYPNTDGPLRPRPSSRIFDSD